MDGGGEIKSLYCTFLYIVLFLHRLVGITVLAVRRPGSSRLNSFMAPSVRSGADLEQCRDKKVRVTVSR